MKRKSDAELTAKAEWLYTEYVATQGTDNAIKIFAKALKKAKNKRKEFRERDKK